MSDNWRFRPQVSGEVKESPAVGAALHVDTARSQGVAKLQRSPLDTVSVKYTPVSRADQLRRALPVFLAGRERILAGELPNAVIGDVGGGRIESEYCRRAMRAVLWTQDLLEWERSPATIQSARLRAWDAAIRLCRIADARRGGWVVSSIH
jgi:hypothetical protein